MQKLFKYLSILLIIWCICINPAAAANIKIDAKTDKKKVQTGEVFTYTADIEGDSSSLRLKTPELNDFVIVSQKQKRNYTSHGKETKVTIKLMYSLLSYNPGIFNIEGIVVKDKNEIIKSEPIKIEVTGKPLKEKGKTKPYLGSGTDI